MNTVQALPFQAHSPTSKAAADSVKPDATTQRLRILRLISELPSGLTDEQVSELTGLSGNTVRPRRVELVKAGLVKDSGRTRPTQSGRKATVWIA